MIDPYIVYFYTYLFEYGIFLDSLQTVAVTPIFKTDSLVRILFLIVVPYLYCLVCQKFLEKLIKVRVTYFLEQHQILYSHQYGFRAKHSIEHAIQDITTTLYNMLNDKSIPCLAMIELKKAFDARYVTNVLC